MKLTLFRAAIEDTFVCDPAWFANCNEVAWGYGWELKGVITCPQVAHAFFRDGTIPQSRVGEPDRCFGYGGGVVDGEDAKAFAAALTRALADIPTAWVRRRGYFGQVVTSGADVKDLRTRYPDSVIYTDTRAHVPGGDPRGIPWDWDRDGFYEGEKNFDALVESYSGPAWNHLTALIDYVACGPFFISFND